PCRGGVALSRPLPTRGARTRVQRMEIVRRGAARQVLHAHGTRTQIPSRRDRRLARLREGGHSHSPTTSMSAEHPAPDGAQLFRPPVDREIEKELEFHIAMRVKDLVARGKSMDEAQRIARAEIGDM